ALRCDGRASPSDGPVGGRGRPRCEAGRRLAGAAARARRGRAGAVPGRGGPTLEWRPVRVRRRPGELPPARAAPRPARLDSPSRDGGPGPVGVGLDAPRATWGVG